MPLRRILLPLDGSPAAEAVLTFVRRLLRRGTETELVLFQCVSPLVPGAEEAFESSRSYLLKLEDALTVQGLKARAVVEPGSPPDAIVRLAEREGADLIAMATHGRTGLARAVLGSVTERVLRKTPVPVILAPTLRAPDAPERSGLRNLLLALDGSDGALRAFPAAVGMARLFSARLLLFTALGSEWDRPDAERHHRKVEQRCRDEGVAVISLLEQGDPVDEILDVARFHEVDLIALATHGRGGVARLVTGRVTEGVLRKSDVPLLLVRST